MVARFRVVGEDGDLDHGDEIWNRAIDIRIDVRGIAGPGDRALAAALLTELMIHKSGVMNAVEGLESKFDLSRATGGSAFLQWRKRWLEHVPR